MCVADGDNGLLVTISCFDNEPEELRVHGSDTVAALKQHIQETLGYPAAHMSLFFAHSRMQDDDTLASYGVRSGANISVLVALRGC